MCLAIILDHHTELHRAVGMCMLGFRKDDIVLEEILRQAGAPDGIANQVEAFKKRANQQRSEALQGNQLWKLRVYSGHNAETRSKISAALKGKSRNVKNQAGLVWQPYQDEILVELMLTFPAYGKDMDWVVEQEQSAWNSRKQTGNAVRRQTVDWIGMQESPLWQSLPDRHKSGSSARMRIHNLRRGIHINGVRYYESLVGKLHKKLRESHVPPPPPTTNAEQLEVVKNTTKTKAGKKLNSQHKLILDKLSDGETHNKDDLARAVGFVSTRVFTDRLGELRSAALVEFPDFYKTARLTDKCFVKARGKE